MNTNLSKIVLAISMLLLLAAPFLVGSLLSSWNIEYLVPIFMAIITLGIACLLPLHQKRITSVSVLFLFVGLLFVLSSVISYAYAITIHLLPMDDRINFSRMMEPQKVSQGLSQIATGFLYTWLMLRESKWNIASFFLMLLSTLRRALFVDIDVLSDSPFMFLAVGVLYVFLGIFQVITGL